MSEQPPVPTAEAETKSIPTVSQGVRVCASERSGQDRRGTTWNHQRRGWCFSRAAVATSLRAPTPIRAAPYPDQAALTAYAAVDP